MVSTLLLLLSVRFKPLPTLTPSCTRAVRIAPMGVLPLAALREASGVTRPAGSQKHCGAHRKGWRGVREGVDGGSMCGHARLYRGRFRQPPGLGSAREQRSFGGLVEKCAPLGVRNLLKLLPQIGSWRFFASICATSRALACAACEARCIGWRSLLHCLPTELGVTLTHAAWY